MARKLRIPTHPLSAWPLETLNIPSSLCRAKRSRSSPSRKHAARATRVRGNTPDARRRKRIVRRDRSMRKRDYRADRRPRAPDFRPEGLKQAPRSDVRRLPLDLRVEIEERLQAGLQLLLDFFFAAFEDMHGDVRLASILQFEGCVADFRDFVRGQQPHAINEG